MTNGFAWLAPPNDTELEDILKKDRDPWRTLQEQIEELTELFRARMQAGRGGGNGQPDQYPDSEGSGA